MIKNKPYEKKQSTDQLLDKENQTIAILMKEYDILSEMYSQAVHHGQTMFNYYLTLMTAVFGGVALVIQPSSGVYLPRTTISILLTLFAVIGSFYLSSLSTNFAHATRYAWGINEIRKYILKNNKTTLPSVYDKFLSEEQKEKDSSVILFLSFFIPVNTYQLFVATVNSLSWAIAISIVYYAYADLLITDAALRGVLAFIITYLIYSVYARLIYRMTISRAGIVIGH